MIDITGYDINTLVKSNTVPLVHKNSVARASCRKRLSPLLYLLSKRHNRSVRRTVVDIEDARNPEFELQAR